MPQAPSHCSDVSVYGWALQGNGLRSRDVIGNLLHGLDLHGDVDPVEDVGCRLRHSAEQSLENLCAVRNHRHIAIDAVSDSFRRVEGAVANCLLSGATGDEVATTWFASSFATASGNDDLEASRCICVRAASISGLDADDEFLAAIVRELQLKLATIIRLRTVAYVSVGLVGASGAGNG